MCDRRYDLDCLEGIGNSRRLETKSATDCELPVENRVITHNNNNNNNMQLPPQRQIDGQQPQPQQNKQSQQLESRSVQLEAGNTRSSFESKRYDLTSRLLENTSTGSMTLQREDENLLTCMLITANVGTIFEESTLLELWFEQLKSYLIKIKPQLVAIHCQEVGGKNYETSMKNVSSFTDKILGDDKIIGDYSRVRIFLDENFECLEKFTALGSLYLIHDSVDNVKLYNFKTAQYDTVEGRTILAAQDKRDLMAKQARSTNAEDQETSEQATSCGQNRQAEHVEKIKFPQELFPECRLSRKGFMRTRWLFNDYQPLDLVNIHLFHDASNLVAMKTTPSPYAQNRQKALEFALSKIFEPLEVVISDNNNRGHVTQNLITKTSLSSSTSLAASKSPSASSVHHQDQAEQVPLFIFGDFNFRLNTSKVIQRITEGLSPVVKRNANSDEVLEIIYHRKVSDCGPNELVDCNECDKQSTTTTKDNGTEVDESGVLMTVGKKLFDYKNLDETFRATKNTEWLLELDNELDSFKRQLFEFKISFSPSYPFKEDQSGGYSYMKTRCPAWCDRILFNEAAYRLIKGNAGGAQQQQLVESSLKSEKSIELLQSQGDVIYRLMGNSVPMGDHKPVLLYCQLDVCNQQNKSSKQSPSTKCNQSVKSGAGASLEENLIESTAM